LSIVFAKKVYFIILLDIINNDNHCLFTCYSRLKYLIYKDIIILQIKKDGANMNVLDRFWPRDELVQTTLEIESNLYDEIANLFNLFLLLSMFLTMLTKLIINPDILPSTKLLIAKIIS